MDLDEEKIINLLDQINGVLFTGGFTDLILENGDQTPYYQTAKTIYNYCLRKKDEKGEEWPIIGICQGYEVIGIINNEDKLSILDKVKIYE